MTVLGGHQKIDFVTRGSSRGNFDRIGAMPAPAAAAVLKVMA